jgi:hypothetical protein
VYVGKFIKIPASFIFDKNLIRLQKEIFMKKILLILLIIFPVSNRILRSQPGNDTLVYLITCGPGTETYSIYGHSAIRIVFPVNHQDLVFNWGVFDFETPHFVWKFAKGRLDYMLAVESMKSFTSEYFYEKRYVLCQKLNISPAETKRMILLIIENLRPENVKYRYDFFYDNCSTRIRDLIEKTMGKSLLYPPETGERRPTFRQLITGYQRGVPWLTFGIDLLLGAPVDKRASYRDLMFLPLYMQKELSEAVVNRDGKMVPLLQNPDSILDFPVPVLRQNYLETPAFVLTIFFTSILLVSALVKKRRFIRWLDIVLFFVFSLLAVLMVFFNFFADHVQVKLNFNIVWINPLIIFCFVSLIINKPGRIWFKWLFYVLTAFLVIYLLLPQSFNIAILPLVLTLMVRSSARAGFGWSPFTIK